MWTGEAGMCRIRMCSLDIYLRTHCRRPHWQITHEATRVPILGSLGSHGRNCFRRYHSGTSPVGRARGMGRVLRHDGLDHCEPDHNRSISAETPAAGIFSARQVGALRPESRQLRGTEPLRAAGSTTASHEIGVSSVFRPKD